VGSITHTRGFCAAACARSDDYLSLGVDAEPDEPLPAEIIDEVKREFFETVSAMSERYL
jgi:4'-phosphopantetheinyl transferase EntD